MCVKCGVRVVGRVEAGLREMSWFRRHLNWTALLALVLAIAASFVAAFAVGFAMGYADPYVSDEALEGAGYVVGALATLAVLAPSWGWVLRRKNRSLWWLLLALFVPLGWIAMFVLENRSG